MNIQVEKYEEEEPYELLEFARRNFIEAYAHLNTAENMEAYVSQTFTPEAFFQHYHHPHSTCFIARSGKEIVGYFKVNIDAAQTEPNHPDSCEIERIYVDTRFKGRGIGKKLFYAAVDYGKQLKRHYLWLGVWEENHDAIRFYQKIGMKPFGTHSFQLGDEEQTDILMRLDLNA